MELKKPIIINKAYCDMEGNTHIVNTYQYYNLPYNTNINKFHDFIKQKEQEAIFNAEQFENGVLRTQFDGDTMTVFVDIKYIVESDGDDALY